jgi:hypothetical protein
MVVPAQWVNAGTAARADPLKPAEGLPALAALSSYLERQALRLGGASGRIVSVVLDCRLLVNG